MTYSEDWRCDCCGKVHRLIINAEDCTNEDDASMALFDEFSPDWNPGGTMLDGRELGQIGPCCTDRFTVIDGEYVEFELVSAQLFTGVA